MSLFGRFLRSGLKHFAETEMTDETQGAKKDEPFDLPSDESYVLALALVRQLDGLSVLDAELVLKDAMSIVKRVSVFSASAQRLATLEEWFPSSS